MNIDLQQKLISIVGSEKYREVAKAIEEHGIDVVTPVDKINIKLPTIEISSVSSSDSLKPPRVDMVRRFAFRCLVNGEEIPELSRIELDPFDVQDGEPYKVKLVLSPFFGGKNDQV